MQSSMPCRAISWLNSCGDNFPHLLLGIQPRTSEVHINVALPIQFWKLLHPEILKLLGCRCIAWIELQESFFLFLALFGSDLTLWKILQGCL